MERAQRTVNLLFLLNVACFWFGCNNAAKEIVKERAIYTREHDVNLRIDAYCASKFAVLVLIALVQVSILLGIVRLGCGPSGSVVGQWFALAALAVSGTALGLLISALAPTEEVAVALVPVAIMPQIILAGVIATLSGPPDWFAKAFITSNWGTRALQALLPDNETLHPYFGPIALIGVHTLFFLTLTGLTLWCKSRS